MKGASAASGRVASGVAAYAWVVLAAVFVASVAAPVNQFKVPPVMPALIRDFGLDMTSAGMLMSVFSLAGLAVAFPAGALLSRVGCKLASLGALALVIAGSLAGTFAGSDGALLACRALEGAGMALLGVTAPVAVAAWFPPEHRGLPMGIWSAWVSTGVILMMNVSPLVTPPGQWTPTWWLGTGFAVAALVFFAALHRDPGTAAGEGGGESLRAMFKEALAIRDVWLISLCLFCFNIMVLALNTFFPTYLVRVHGLPMAEADFLSSLPNAVMLVSCPLGGWIADRTGARKAVFSGCLALLGLWWIVAFRLPAVLMAPALAVFGLLAGPVITTIITALPEAVRRPALIGFGMSLLMFWHHLGEFAGPVYFGEMLDRTGSWQAAALGMVPVCAAGALCGWRMRTA